MRWTIAGLLIYSFLIPQPIQGCAGGGGSALQIAITGNIVEFSNNETPKETSLEGIIVSVLGTDIFTITNPDGSFKITNIPQINRIILNFKKGFQKVNLDLGIVEPSQTIRLYDIRITPLGAEIGYKKTEDFWKRFVFQEHDQARPKSLKHPKENISKQQP